MTNRDPLLQTKLSPAQALAFQKALATIGDLLDPADRLTIERCTTGAEVRFRYETDGEVSASYNVDELRRKYQLRSGPPGFGVAGELLHASGRVES